MKFLLLLWQDEANAPAYGTPEFESMLAAYGAYHDDLNSRGLHAGGDPLARSADAVTIRSRGGRPEQQDAPFSAGPEQLIGYYLLECRDRAEALEAAARIPAAKTGAIEVRAIHQM